MRFKRFMAACSGSEQDPKELVVHIDEIKFIRLGPVEEFIDKKCKDHKAGKKIQHILFNKGAVLEKINFTCDLVVPEGTVEKLLQWTERFLESEIDKSYEEYMYQKIEQWERMNKK